MITWQVCKHCDGQGTVIQVRPPNSRYDYDIMTCPDCAGYRGMHVEIDDEEESEDE